MTTREAFEAFISAPPFEMPTERFDDRGAWPGGYTEDGVERRSRGRHRLGWLGGKQERAEARQAALEKDAARYRWLKGRQGLTLRSEKQPNLWKRIDGTEFSATHSLAEGGTQHAPTDSLDALIDAAMMVARIRDA